MHGRDGELERVAAAEREGEAHRAALLDEGERASTLERRERLAVRVERRLRPVNQSTINQPACTTVGRRSSSAAGNFGQKFDEMMRVCKLMGGVVVERTYWSHARHTYSTPTVTRTPYGNPHALR